MYMCVVDHVVLDLICNITDTAKTFFVQVYVSQVFPQRFLNVSSIHLAFPQFCPGRYSGHPWEKDFPNERFH